MPDITTDVLIVGTGPAGSATAALLSTYGIRNLLINRYHWLANTPRAHITNQRTMEVLRDLGRDVEKEAYLFATEQDLMGENVFCTSITGEEIGRIKKLGNSSNFPRRAPTCLSHRDERSPSNLYGTSTLQDGMRAWHERSNVDRIC